MICKIGILSNYMERWPSGRRRSPAKGVCGQPYRGFESLSLRHREVELKFLIVFIFLLLVSCSDSSQEVKDYKIKDSSEYVQSKDYNVDRNVYFGDTHVHTKYSFDAFIFGTTNSPDDAYKYAKGGTIQHPLGFDMTLREPLDFYAVTDHGSVSYTHLTLPTICSV